MIRMKSMTGEERAPVLALGDKIIVKGYSEARWQAALDEAGYPKTPAPRRTATGARHEPRRPAARVGRRAPVTRRRPRAATTRSSSSWIPVLETGGRVTSAAAFFDAASP